MPDMLVKLYDLPDPTPMRERVAQAGCVIRPAMTFEQDLVCGWIREHFSEAWASETQVCFARQPVSCLIAVREGQMLGFACYDATVRGFFGPTGVDEAQRGHGIGAALLIESLLGLKALGYGYGIIGAAGPTTFYEKAIGAIAIPDSSPGVYADLLTRDSP